jgi:D-glycero-D-manno-heptose 1,7-bisphosphate phosphatase
MMRRWKAGGGRIVGVSNQGGIALGHLSMQDCAAAMVHTHVLSGQLFDKILWCRHHPKSEDPVFARCWCRKPAPGLLIEATMYMALEHKDEVYPLHMALMVGDRPEDEECARIVGIDFQWAHEWRAQA